ncbi:GntR family transcriptional regulator [Afifella sp. IM 167]|uniref:GntR family transcriptional regulator n=1 Tax=Afifella sp. IM 167 TaxID=2033586 RepID=UPI001CCF6E4E|nr:GntR family transcriptional regulator [Afifella sp. IM 167]MBZ8133840.1 GntR family transcriptional regulator [Afifella sp. IM 167]
MVQGSVKRGAEPTAAETGSGAGLGFRPLYLQVREKLTERMIGGLWPPGMLLPSEQRLAAELGVSQGTVRKALDAMAADHLLVRRQGRGTFVAEQEEGRILFQFFRLRPDDGRAPFPESTPISLRPDRAGEEEAELLRLAPRARVWRLQRLRALDGVPLITEEIVLPFERFRRLEKMAPLPNNLYAFYAGVFGITIARAEERLKAVAAGPEDAAALGCLKGTPLLEVDRIAFGLDEKPVERRISRCLTDAHHYSSTPR